MDSVYPLYICMRSSMRIVMRKHWLLSRNCPTFATMKPKTITITPNAYATMRGVSLSAVTKQIRKSKPMPGVISVNSYGRFYTLTVDEQQVKNINKK